MDKLEKMKQAEQFIQKDILYGTIAGQRVIDILENHCDDMVNDDETVDQLAARIKSSLLTKFDEPLYVPVHSTVNDSLPSDIFSDNSKELFKEEMLSSFPYTGNIIYEGREINIAEYIKSLPLNDDYKIQIDPSLPPRSISDEYKQILMFEPERLSMVEKEQAFLKRFDLFRSNHSNIDDILQENESFQEDLINGLKNMNDRYDIVIDETKYDIDEYIDNLYKKYSERLYNSVDSKPSLVEPINITRGNGVSEATSNYIFLNNLDVQSIINNKFSYTMDDKLRDIFIGILRSDTKSIESYTDIVNELVGVENDNPLKDKVAKVYVETKRNAQTIVNNGDDLLLIIEKDLDDIEKDLTDLKIEYSRSFIMDMDDIGELSRRLNDIEVNASSMNINMGNKFEEIKKQIEEFGNLINFTKPNEDHNKKETESDLDWTLVSIKNMIREMEYVNKATEKAGLEIRIQQKVRDYKKILEDKKMLFSDDELFEYSSNIDRVFINNDKESLMGRGR